jgi:hypothetical protein
MSGPQNKTKEHIMEAVLELIPATRIGVKYPNGTYKSERHFLDFVVNGESLWDAVGKQHDIVSALCADYGIEEVKKAVGRLLLTEKADLPNNRRSLFICSECGDLGCGAITAAMVKEHDTITWKDFGYENNYEDAVLLEKYKSLGPFTFKTEQYEGTLLQAIERLTGSPT